MTTKTKKSDGAAANIEAAKNVLKAHGVHENVLEKWDGMIASDTMALPDGDDTMRIANYIGWTDVAEANREYMSVTTPGDVKEFLDANRGKEVTFLLNTPGGSVFGGTEIANLIKGHDADTCAIVTGIAASVGSLIAAACTKVEMMEASMMMVHGPQTFAYGSADDMDRTAERLRKEAMAVAPIYKNRMDADEVDRMLASGDHYFTADEAVESGLADGIYADAEDGDGDGDNDADTTKDNARINTTRGEEEARAVIAKRNSDNLSFLATGMLNKKETV